MRKCRLAVIGCSDVFVRTRLSTHKHSSSAYSVHLRLKCEPRDLKGDHTITCASMHGRSGGFRYLDRCGTGCYISWHDEKHVRGPDCAPSRPSPSRGSRGAKGSGIVRFAMPSGVLRRGRDQAAHRPQGSWPIRRVPHDRGFSPRRAGVLRPWVCEERPRQPSAQGTLGVAVAGKRVSGSERCGACGRAGCWSDNRGGMR